MLRRNPLAITHGALALLSFSLSLAYVMDGVQLVLPTIIWAVNGILNIVLMYLYWERKEEDAQ